MKNKDLLWLLLIVVLIAVTIGAILYYRSNSPVPIPENTTQQTPQAEEPKSGAVSVEMKNFAFNPASITVKTGTKVTWTNLDSSSHTVTGNGIESGTLNQNQSFSKTFSETGTFSYHCSPHPYMTGTVIVVQ